MRQLTAVGLTYIGEYATCRTNCNGLIGTVKCGKVLDPELIFEFLVRFRLVKFPDWAVLDTFELFELQSDLSVLGSQ